MIKSTQTESDHDKEELKKIIGGSRFSWTAGDLINIGNRQTKNRKEGDPKNGNTQTEDGTAGDI